MLEYLILRMKKILLEILTRGFLFIYLSSNVCVISLGSMVDWKCSDVYKEANVTREERKKKSWLLYDANSYRICFKAHHSFFLYLSFVSYF
jgi:hypothetical protein